MIERDLLLNAATALLLGCLAWQHEAVSRRFGRGGLLLYALGALLPFADPLLAYGSSLDRIELLSRPPLMQAPLLGLLGIAVLAVLAGVAVAPRRGLAVGLGLAAGYGTHAALSALTPTGWPLLAPFRGGRIALPILPAGHLALLALLFVAVMLGEALPRRRGWLVPLAGSLAVAFALAGAVQFGVLSYRAENLSTPGATTHVYPDGDWLLHWRILLEGPQRYALRRVTLLTEPLPEPRVVPRWNDEPLFLKLLGDPVVNRYYFEVFQHPVVRLDVSGAHITLLMQEVRDQSPQVPGRTFYLESDLSGRNRFYQLQRFN